MVIFTSIHTLAYPGAITRLKVVNHHLKSISNDMHLLSKLQVVDQFHIVVTPGLCIGLCPCAPQILDLDGNNLKFLPTCVSAMHLQTLSLKKVAHACASLTIHNTYCPPGATTRPLDVSESARHPFQTCWLAGKAHICANTWYPKHLDFA